MQKRQHGGSGGRMSDDISRLSLFGSLKRPKLLRSSVNSRQSAFSPEELASPAFSLRIPFTSRVKTAMSGKLTASMMLNPPQTEPAASSTEADLQKHGFSIINFHPLRRRLSLTNSVPSASTAWSLKQSLLQQTLLNQYKREQAAKERLLNDQLDQEEQQAQEAPNASVPVLTDAQLANVKQFFASAKRQPHKIVTEAFKIELSLADLATLQPGKWLNDNVIDMYLALITAEHPKSTSVFSTHFFSRLDADGYPAVRRWAIRKKLNVFEPKYVFVPVNRGNMHWTLAVINNHSCQLEFYDSLPSGKGQRELEVLREYLRSESARLKVPFPNYKLKIDENGPTQTNGSDCGVFVCETVRRLANDLGLKYTQKHMPDVRLYMASRLIEMGSPRSNL